MRLLKYHFPVAIILLIAVIVAGCGGTTGTTTPPAPTVTPASVPTATPSPTQVPTPSPTPQPMATPPPVNALIHTGQVTVNGTVETVLTNANGQQVEYDGHLLYTFVGDSAAGQAHGGGIVSFGGTWHVVTPNL